MCLAVPGKVVEIQGEGELRMGRIDFAGVQRQACLAYTPDVRVGEYVLVHVGFAISRIDEQAAMETLEALEQIGELAESGRRSTAGDRGPEGTGGGDASR